MPTKRRRVPPRRLTQMPGWAERLLAGERPDPGSEDEHALFGWLYFNDSVPGLPPADTPEGYQLWGARADEA